MANEFIARNGLISQNNITITGSAFTLNSSSFLNDGNDPIWISRGANNDNYSLIIGPNLSSAKSTATENTGLGNQVLQAIKTGTDHTAVGTRALFTLESYDASGSSQNTAIGAYSLSNIAYPGGTRRQSGTGSSNTAVGAYAGYFSYGNSNTYLGVSAGAQANDSYYNTYIGYLSGYNQRDSFYNTFIGSNFQGTSFTNYTSSNNVVISDGSGSVRFYSPSSANVILGGFTDTGEKLQVSGSGKFTNGLTVTGSVLIRTYAHIGDTSDYIRLSSDTIYGRGNMGTGVTIEPGTSGQRNLRILTPTDGGSGIISIGYYKDAVGPSWNRAFSVSTVPAIPHVMIQPDSGNTVLGTSTDIGAKLGVHGSGTTSATTGLRIEKSDSNPVLVTLDNGNVGIGLSSPLSPLQISGFAIITNPAGGNYNENLRLPQANSGYASLCIGGAIATSGTTSEQWTFVKYPVTNDFSLRNSSTDYMYITQGGLIGIGTSTPSSKLHISGSDGANTFRIENKYTPTNTADPSGQGGNISWDDSYIYVKTSLGWKRLALSTF